TDRAQPDRYRSKRCRSPLICRQTAEIPGGGTTPGIFGFGLATSGLWDIRARLWVGACMLRDRVGLAGVQGRADTTSLQARRKLAATAYQRRGLHCLGKLGPPHGERNHLIYAART